MLLVIDNYDSFTWNLVRYLRELGQTVEVVRNDKITLSGIADRSPDCLLISPGPCTPTEAGISVAAIEHFAGRIPVLGVCLGHQSIGQAFGGQVIRARQVMHGKTSAVYHAGQGVFRGLPNPFQVARYHSLVLDPDCLPACLEVTAWTQHDDGRRDEIMAVRHNYLAVEGVQFHPEAILTQQGHALLANFLQQPVAAVS
ncbi:anthranilate synthase component II [Nitrincola iocasae]|jgi:anthranilate synthase component 2|uniref:Aminodeoxychorismate/anthranilate synthase component II n=1 Tax=Nitrincola iocasae TaxID=2614693 RepID=A0A5J6LAF8_9GAMM|nr:aminodeoxychorismate/anthranilate synthase component II [Nitrincola iocasae]QEW05589.1 aminodeoxychorismate/anthranilate synthase component II [Nitrincola iocasae]